MSTNVACIDAGLGSGTGNGEMRAADVAGAEGPQSTVDRLHAEIRRMAMRYELRPDARINEGELARKLGASRTPLREALNRLAIEGFLSAEPGKGFFGRSLNVQYVFDLYEARKLLETSAVAVSCARATPDQLDKIEAFLQSTTQDGSDVSVRTFVENDEAFHESLVALSGNAELLRQLKSINARISFMRHLDLDSEARRGTQSDHQKVLQHLRKGRPAEAAAVLERHIDRRMDQISNVVRRGIADLYLQQA